MKLPVDYIDAIEDLNSTQVKAIQALLAEITNYMGGEVLKSSVGDGSTESERRLIFAKARHEGAMKVETFLIQQIQKLKSEAEKRRQA